MPTKQIPKTPWGKSIIAVYFLLVAYKKTINAKLKYYLASSPNTPFFFTLAPFFAYFIQLTFSKYPFSYEQNAFFQKSIPGLVKPVQKMTWETFAYTKYSKKLDVEFITKVNLLDDSFFLSLNPFWNVKKQQLYTGQFESSNLNWSFIPSRYFYHRLSTSEKQSLISNFSFEAKKFDDFYLQKKKDELNSEVRFWKNFKLLSCGPIQSSLPNYGLQGAKPGFFFKVQPLKKNHPSDSLKNLNFVQSNVFLNKLTFNARWQFFFNELDDIPTKLNSVFSPGFISLETLRKSKLRTQNQVLESNLFPVSSETLFGEEREISFLKKRSATGSEGTGPDSLNLKSLSPLSFSPTSSFANLINADPFNKAEVTNLEEKKNQLLLNQFKRKATRLMSNYHNLACTKNSESEIGLLSTKDLKKDPPFFFKLGHERNQQFFSGFSRLQYQSTAIEKNPFSFQPIGQLKQINQKTWVNKKDLQRTKMIGILNEKEDFIKKTFSSLERQKSVSDLDKNLYEQEGMKTNTLPRSLSFYDKDFAFLEKNGDESFDYTGVDFLMETFNNQSKKEKSSLFLKRNFHYNLGFGFSQLGKLIKLNVLQPNFHFKRSNNIKTNEFTRASNFFKFVEKTNSFDIFSNDVSLKWKKVIRKNLTNSPPTWIALLKNSTNKNQPIDESSRMDYLLNPLFERNDKNLIGNKQVLSGLNNLNAFLEIRSFEKTLLNSFKFNKAMTTRVFEKPELILELFKKQKVGFPEFFERSSKNIGPTNQAQSPVVGRPFDLAKFVPLQQTSTRDATKFSQTSKIKAARVLKNSNLFAQRKVSGYLYPDSLRQTIAFNISQLKGQNPVPFYQTPGFFKVKTNLKQNQSPLRKNQTRNLSFYDKFLPVSFSLKDLVHFSFNEKKPLKKVNNWGLLVQVYQPLIGDSGKCPTFSPGIQNPSQTYLDLAKLFVNKEDLRTKISFDNPSTTTKNYFFGKPTKSPIYGVPLKDYLLKYNKPNSQVDKKLLISPYSDPVNFFIRLKSHFENKTRLNLEDQQSNSPSKELIDLAKKKTLTETTKVTSFSFVKLNENKMISLFKSPLDITDKRFFPEQKTVSRTNNKLDEKTCHKMTSCGSRSLSQRDPFFKISDKYSKTRYQNQPIFYRTHCNYTKSHFLPSSVKNFNQPLIKTSFITDLYEPATLKSWAIVSQLGFSLMVLKGLGVLRKEYSEEIVYYIDQFAASLNEFDKEALKALILKDNFRVIKKTDKKFIDLVGGDFLLTEFGEVILLLRNSRKDFLKMTITKPKFISVKKQNRTQSTKLNFFPQELNEIFTKTIKSFVHLKNQVSQVSSFVSNPNLDLETLIQKTILLVGPPGTGKTLFVQALAGEAGVPILLESGKMLTTNMESPGPEKLTDLFKAAREMSPCILFLDEVDTIGQKRDNIISSFAFSQNKKQIPSTLNFIYLQNGRVMDSEISDPFYFDKDLNHKWDILNPVLKFQISQKTTKTETEKQNLLKIQITNQEQINTKNKDQDLAMLTQLLCELDGLTKNQDIIVIGATNRPATLDPALTRPGRFGKILYLELPGKQKRFELLKFYSRSLLPVQTFDSFSKTTMTSLENGQINRPSQITKPLLSNTKKFPQTLSLSKKTARKAFKKDPLFTKSIDVTEVSLKNESHELDANINWDYFANQTVGLSAAHLEAAMNRSALKIIARYLAKNKKKSVFSPFFDVSKPVSSPKKSFDLKLENLSTNTKSCFLEKLPKEFKLRFLTQFTNNKNENFSQLFESYKRKTASATKFRFSSLTNEPFFKTLKTVNENENPGFLNLTKKTLVSSSLTFLKQKPLTTIKQRLFPRSLSLSTTNRDLNYPFHTFETIEYGIQTISTLNTNAHLHLTLGNKVMKKLLGQIAITDLMLPTVSNQKKKMKRRLQQGADLDIPLVKRFGINLKESLNFSKNYALFAKVKFKGATNFVALRETVSSKLKKNHQDSRLDSTTLAKSSLSTPKKSLIRSLKQQGKKRKSFYQKHRFYLRILVLLGVNKKVEKFVSLPEKTKGHEKNKFLVTQIESKSQILNKYINRIIQNQSLGWVLLNNSTCLIQNPLFHFSIQHSNFKNRNSIYYSFLSLKDWDDSSKSFWVQKKQHLLLNWKNFHLNSQTSLFGDALFINRSAYYLSGNAFIRFATLNETKKEKPIRLWTFTGLTQTRHKQKFQSKPFLTKIQFEKCLLSLIAGKATETLLLANYSNDLKKNHSNIGIAELKEFGSLMSLMSEKHLFYSQKQLTQKQININLVKNKAQNQQKETLLFLSQFSTLLEIKTQTETHLPSNFLRDQFYLKWVDKPWWQSKSSTLVSSNNLQYGQWYRLFVSEEKQNFRNIEWIAPDTYFHNHVNNRMLLPTQKKICNIKWNDKKVENYFINRELVEQYFQFCNLNWNQLQLFESESLTFYFIFESFNKVFKLLEKNRELIDSLVYSLLCHESVRDFEIQNTHQRYLNQNFQSLTETKTKKA